MLTAKEEYYMQQKTMGTVIKVSRQWWLKVNTKALRRHALDGAFFPHIIKVNYTVDGRNYVKRKWIPAKVSVPIQGSKIEVIYSTQKPAKATINIATSNESHHLES